MHPGIRISLEGLPGNVQLFADVIDCAMPDTITWQEVPALFVDGIIRIDGTSAPLLHFENERERP